MTGPRNGGYSAIRAPPRWIDRAPRGAHSHRDFCCGIPADRTAARRGRDPARASWDDHRAGRSSPGPDHGHPHAVRPTACRLLTHARRHELQQPAEHIEPGVESVCREAPARAAGGRRDVEACDPRGDGPAELHDPAERHGRGAACDPVGAGGEALVRAQALSELPLHPRTRPQSRPDRRGRRRHRRRNGRRGSEDRGRRRRRRSFEQILRPGGLQLPGGLPEGRQEMDDAEGDRRALLRRHRRGRQDPSGARPGGFLPRHARRGNRCRQRRYDRTRRRRPPGDSGTVRCGATCADRQLPGLQRPDACWSRGQHTGDRRRVRSGGARRHGRDQLLGRRPTARSGERCDHRGGPERLRRRRCPGDLRRQRPRRLRPRLRGLARDCPGRDLGCRALQFPCLRPGAHRHRARSCRPADPRPVRPHRGDAAGLGKRRPAARRRRDDHGHEQRSGAP